MEKTSPRSPLGALALALLAGCAPLTLSAQTVTWDGSTDSTWSQPDNTSWGASTYDSGNTAQFLGAGAGTVTIQAGGVTPGAVIVNSGLDYTFTGGSISGATTTLSKSGTGTLSLNSSNIFNGGVTLSGGTLRATVNPSLNALGTSAISIAPGATLQWDNTNTSNVTTTVANTTTGSGRLIMNFATGGSARNTQITGLSGFTGTIELTKASAATTPDKWNANVGTRNASLIINPGTQLYLTGNSAFTGGITVSGTGNSENRGAIRAQTGTLGGNLTLLGSTTVGTEGGNLSGTISTGVAGTSTLTLGTGSSGGNITLSGVLSNGTGTLALTKNTTRDHFLTGNNTYSGTTTITAGRLILQGAGTVGSGAVTVSSGAQFYFARGGTITNAFTISGDGNNGLDTQPRGALRVESGGTIAGTVALASAASIGSYSGNTGTIAANISGAFPLTINASSSASPGRIIFSGTNTYSGGTTVANGTLQINAPAALPTTGTHTVNPGATLELVSSGTNTYAQTLAGGGRVLLNMTGGTQNTYLTGAGGFTGLLELSGNSGNKLNTSGLNLNTAATIRVNPGGQLFLNGGTIANSIQIAGTGNTENRGAIRATGGTITGDINLLGNASIGPEGGTITGTISSGAAGSQTLTLGAPNSNGTLNISGAVTNGTGTLALVKASNSTVTLSGANTYSGGTTISDGTLLVNNTTGSGVGSGAVTVLSGATLGGTGFLGTPSSLITVAVASGGTLSPGNSPGTLTLYGNTTLQPGATLLVDVVNPTTDLLVINSGTVTVAGATLGGSWGGDSSNVFSGTYDAASMHWLIDNQGTNPIAGTFANSTLAPSFAGLFGNVDPYLVSVGGQLFAAFYESQFGVFSQAGLTGGNDLLLIAIPEPSRPLLLAAALAPLLLRRRRR